MSDTKTQVDEVLEDIEQQLNQPLYAVFDFDNTCIAHDIQQAFILHACRNELLRNNTMMHDEDLAKDSRVYHDAVFTHYWGMLSQGVTGDAFNFLLRGLVGFRTDEIPSLVADIIAEQGDELGSDNYLGIEITKGLRVREPVKKLLQTCQEKNIRIVVVSASPEPLVRAALDYYGLPYDDCIGIKLEVNDDVFVNKIVTPQPIEDGKTVCVQEQVHKTAKPILAVGDSMNDFHLLHYATIAVAIERGTQLGKEALLNHWHVINDDANAQ